MTFVIRGYKPGDEHKILEMFNEIFGQHRDISHWHWKYRDNPYGSYKISLAEASDGTFAAHYAGYPVMVCFYPSLNKPPQETLTYQLGDKMTRREFRSVGFGRRSLIARAYDHFRNNYMHRAIPFAYGFAAQHSHRLGLKILGYHDVEPVPFRKSEFSRIAALRVGAFRKTVTGMTTEINPIIDGAWTEFFSRAASHYGYIVKRDAVYLRWRYIERPDRDYLIISVKKRSKLTGWSVFFREQERIIWGDALFTPNDAESVKAVLVSLKFHPMSRGAETLEGWFPPRPLWWDELLRKLGLEAGSEPHGLRFVVPIWRDPHESKRLGQSFYYTMGDSDLF